MRRLLITGYVLLILYAIPAPSGPEPCWVPPDFDHPIVVCWGFEEIWL